jgi:hypothetical protein
MQNSSKQARIKSVNGRNDQLSGKREAKRAFKEQFGITSGRQYRIMKKKLQRGELG